MFTSSLRDSSALGHAWLTVYPTATVVDVAAAWGSWLLRAGRDERARGKILRRNVSNALCGVAAVQASVILDLIPYKKYTMLSSALSLNFALVDSCNLSL